MSHTRGEADAGDLQAGIETGLVAERDARHLAAEGLAEDRAAGAIGLQSRSSTARLR